MIKLTNVAIVRLKKKGKRFEIACYKNKVMNWRNGIEKDIDEVLQITKVFINVSKGIAADSKSLEKAFNSTNELLICLEILKNGDLQVSKRERDQELKNLYKEIASIVASKCVNEKTKSIFPIPIIEKAMKEINFSINLNRSAKQQAIAIIPELKEVIPIVRGSIRLRIVLPLKTAKIKKLQIIDHIDKLEMEDWTDNYEVIVQITPGKYREIEKIVYSDEKSQSKLEVIDMCVDERKEGINE